MHLFFKHQKRTEDNIALFLLLLTANAIRLTQDKTHRDDFHHKHTYIPQEDHAISHLQTKHSESGTLAIQFFQDSKITSQMYLKMCETFYLGLSKQTQCQSNFTARTTTSKSPQARSSTRRGSRPACNTSSVVLLEPSVKRHTVQQVSAKISLLSKCRRHESPGSRCSTVIKGRTGSLQRQRLVRVQTILSRQSVC